MDNMNNMRKFPDRFNVTIDTYICQQRRIPGNRNMDAKWGYQSSGGWIDSVATRYVWHDNNSPDTFTVATWADKDDWTVYNYRITASDSFVESWLRPIMDKYVEDMYGYHHRNDGNRNDGK